MKASELLAEARDELYQGWTQGQYITNEGSVCAVGAVQKCAMRNMAFAEAGVAQQALNSKAREIYGMSMVQHVNDWDSTGKQDILDLMDKATNYLQEVGN